VTGGHWPVTGREAAAALHKVPCQEGDYGLLLLEDLRDLFAAEKATHLVGPQATVIMLPSAGPAVSRSGGGAAGGAAPSTAPVAAAPPRPRAIPNGGRSRPLPSPAAGPPPGARTPRARRPVGVRGPSHKLWRRPA